MAATVYGFDSSTVKARPDFSASRDAKGAWEASNSFTMLRDTWENFARLVFTKGTQITDLYVELPEYWGFLTLDEVDVSHEPGAITIVSCNYVGFDEEEDELVYTLSATRNSRPIQEHPLFKKDFQGKMMEYSKSIVLAALRGEWKVDIDSPITFEEITYESVNPLTEPHLEHLEKAIKWGRMIFIEGHKTFMSPALQWTEEKSSKNGWIDADLDKFGLVEFDAKNRPPGDPPMPVNGEFEWIRVGMNQNTTNGLTTQSQTWELSPPGGFARFPLPDGQWQGLYTYEDTDIGNGLLIPGLESWQGTL